MSDGLQDLTGEIARLRSECSYVMRVLDNLDALANHRPWLSEEQDSEIHRVNHTYSWSAQENLERATNDLRNWWQALDGVITSAPTRLAY